MASVASSRSGYRPHQPGWQREPGSPDGERYARPPSRPSLLGRRNGKPPDPGPNIEEEPEFRRICDSGRLAPPGTMEPLFVPKSANHCGLQLADLVARPVGVHVLRPDQPNRAYDVIEPKLYRASDGQVDGWGLVRLP